MGSPFHENRSRIPGSLGTRPPRTMLRSQVEVRKKMKLGTMLSLALFVLLAPAPSSAEQFELKPPAQVEPSRLPAKADRVTGETKEAREPSVPAAVAQTAPEASTHEAVPAHVDPPPIPPAVVWAELLTGNARYVLGQPNARELVTRRHELLGGQHPRTIVLTCSDSRVPPELIFDQSLGDLFVIRTAGSVVDAVATASIEYAVEHLGAHLIVVLGHEKCGAVTAALSDERMPSPSLDVLMGHIRPGIAHATTGVVGDERLRRAIEANVDESKRELLSSSPIVRERIEQGSLLVIEAMYALGGGEVRELSRCSSLDEAAPLTAPVALSAPARVSSSAQDAAPPLVGVTPDAKPVDAVKPTDPSSPPNQDAAAPTTKEKARPATSASGGAVPSSPIAWEASMRFRYETRSMLDYRVPGTYKRAATQKLTESGDQSLMRTRIGAGLKLAPGVKGMIVLQDARVMGSEGSPGGMIDNVDLFQAYADIDSIGGRPLALRAGRQVFHYGDGRVLSASEWGNAGRAWDGARLRFAPARWQVDGFVSWVNEGRLAGVDRLLSGANAQWKPSKRIEVESYSVLRSFGDAGYTSEDSHTGRIHDATNGARVRVNHGRVEWKSEAAFQRGHRASDQVRSWFAVTRASMEMPGTWKPRVQAEWLAASGDRTPTDGKTQRYDPIYWGGHTYMGGLDVVGCSNMRDLSGAITVKPWSSGSATAELHRFHLMEAKDAWADDAGTLLRRSTDGSAGTDIGTELDLTWKWDARPRVGVSGGWSRFWRGDFVRKTGGGKDLGWTYLQLALSL